VKLDQRTLFDFKNRDDAGLWVKVNDGVMGGLSQSEMAFTPEGTAVFAGTLSLENYGGFASVRTHPQAYALGDYDGLAVRVRGDGHRFKVRLRTDDHFDGPAYQADLDTQAGVWIVVHVPFEAFVSTFRGRILRDAPPLESARVRQIGFLIADKQEGAFRLEIDWIKAYAGRQLQTGI
jgi:NADH dehydrogenase [ubiquinone] 1 alpha subcomplex assembly factor 1